MRGVAEVMEAAVSADQVAMGETRPPALRKALYLVPDDRFFWSHRRSLAAAARAAGAEVVVATPPGPCVALIEAAGFRHRAVRMTRGTSPGDLARSVLDVVRLYRDERPDLVHHVSMRAVLAGGLAARLVRVPAVVNLVTGLGWVFSDPRPVLKHAVELAYRLCLADPRQWTVFQNPDDRDDFVARGLVAAERSTVILGSGVDASSFQPTPEPDGPPVILFASRMLAPKGVGDLVEAGRMLHRDGVEHEIVLAGAPDALNPSSIQAAELAAWGREHGVRCVGHLDDVRPALAAAHVACLPTWYREGVPRFLIEAMAAGRPIVTTDTPGCRELVRDADTGVLVRPRSPGEIAAALKSLIADPDARRAKGRAARQAFDARLTEEHVIAQTLAVYERATGSAWR
jgi:glycosyltransferase involved in cell wall biosynthesis